MTESRWTELNISELQHQLEDIQREIGGRKGEENGGGLRGEVRRTQRLVEAGDKRVESMDKSMEIRLTRISFWLISLTAAFFLLTGLAVVLLYIALSATGVN